ncbi:unnamed protein product [Pedinophyceae sp. YPF-701]|nr:unnamed protein product [Pedinophyceae sp. YPF-701]
MRNPVTGAPAHRVKKVFVEIDSDDDDDVMEFVDNKQPELQDMFRQLERKLQLRHKGIQAAGSLETGISKDPAFFMAKLRERAVSALGGGGGAGDTSDKDTRRVKFETRAVSGTDP